MHFTKKQNYVQAFVNVGYSFTPSESWLNKPTTACWYSCRDMLAGQSLQTGTAPAKTGRIVCLLNG